MRLLMELISFFCLVFVIIVIGSAVSRGDGVLGWIFSAIFY